MNDRIQTSINHDIITAWNTVLFDKWIQFRDVFIDGLREHGEALLHATPPREGDAVIDLGCGFGETTLRLAAVVGPRGRAVGVDGAARFVQSANEEARRLGIHNARFVEADVQIDDLEGPFDYAYSRFGTMFFVNPVLAMRNVAASLKPDGKLAMVVWRKREDNGWLYEAESVVREFLTEPEHTDEVTCGPGPFSMASADFITTVLGAAGFEQIRLERFDYPLAIGRTLEEAVAFAMSLGPAGEIMRLCGSQAERLRPQIEAEMRRRFGTLPRAADGAVLADSSVWLVSAVRAR